ncbi:MAG: TonB-dependent receptor [Bacteroidales bacterium]|nr:TonB-dependent receptor [Bacteroidales bacterium]MCM1146547.1 TonB-dependent receptor [Bacteroidales bacterium]MCM1205939.1 TonB-dependent receptor [Bacillota bacterium]MCM1510183.1 TonB-dependent receptor [Clostridium sp.]
MKKTILSALFLLLAVIYAQAQSLTVQGTVLSATDDEPLIGASVISSVKGSSGVTTDINGNFTLTVTEGSELTVSFVGFETKTVKASSEMTIRLSEDSELLNEVVVVGYSTEKKSDLTGSVSVVKMKDVADTPTGNVIQSLQGRVAGMTVTTDGTPGGLSTGTSIRGASSFRSDANSPLYVIDGVMTRENPGTIINSNDVESIQVLKDAASASIYGAQAANGVIIITTKRAKSGEAKVTFDATLTAQTYNSGLDLMDAYQWGDVYWSAYKYAHNGNTPSSAIYGNGATAHLQTYKNLNGVDVNPQTTDWENEIHHTALMQTYSIGLAKGTENGSSSLSLSYLDHDGIVKGSDFQRINSRFSSDYGFLRNRLKVGGNVAVNWWRAHYMPDGAEENAVKQHPAKAVYDAEGVYVDQINDILGDAPNMMRLIENNKGNGHSYWRVFGNVYLQIEPVKNLILKTNFGINYYNETNKTFEPAWLRDDVNKLTQSTAKNEDWVWTNTAQYNMDLGKHSIMALAGIESKKYHNESFFGYGTKLTIEDPNYLYLGNVTSGKDVGAGASNYSMFSGFGKINYTYDNKYLASFTIRRDASSRLSKIHNYDWFPSISAGWRISQENFMENTRSWLSDLKLRGSYGVNGNDLIDNEAFYAKYLMSLNRGSYNMSGDGKTLEPGAYRIRTTNPDLKWEKTRQFNIGVDAGFLGNRLTVSIDYFYKRTTDMLVEKPYIATIGEGGYCWYNGGEMTNKGFESQIDWRSRIGNDFSYNIGLNFTVSKNKVTDLLDDIYYSYGGGYANHSLVGHSLGSWMGFKTDGVFHTQEEVDEYCRTYKVEFGNPAVGRIKYVDADGDGKINYNDRTWLGCDLPKAQFGLNLGANWKGFDLSMFFTAIIRDAFNNSKYYTDLFQCWNGNHGTTLVEAANAYERFLETGYYDCDTPAPTTDNNNNEHEVSEFHIENGSFLRMKTLTFGYSLPAAIRTKLHLNNARIYFQAQNLFTITGYSGADPEGLGYPYALPRSYTLGIQFGF